MSPPTDRGCVFGVALVGPAAPCDLVSVDVDGVLWLLDRGSRAQLVRRCLDRQWRVYASLGQLVDALHRGLCFGLSPRMLRDVSAVPWDPSPPGARASSA